MKHQHRFSNSRNILPHRDPSIPSHVGTHGGRRLGAGRKRRMDEGAHAKRPAHRNRHPLHITVRLREGLPSLRNDETMTRLQLAMERARELGLRINHFSILSNHLHMIAEVDGARSLQRGMMSFNSRLGRWLRTQGARPRNARHGFFKGRYHARSITSARQMKNTLRYVLLNASKHFRKIPYIDLFSSGASFAQWRELLREGFSALLKAQVLNLEAALAGEQDRHGTRSGRNASREPPLLRGLSPPKTWLATWGWRKA